MLVMDLVKLYGDGYHADQTGYLYRLVMHLTVWYIFNLPCGSCNMACTLFVEEKLGNSICELITTEEYLALICSYDHSIFKTGVIKFQA